MYSDEWCMSSADICANNHHHHDYNDYDDNDDNDDDDDDTWQYIVI